MERTSPRQPKPQKFFERKESPIMQTSNAMKPEACKSLHARARPFPQRLIHANGVKKGRVELRNHSESNSVLSMFTLLEKCEDNLNFIAASTSAQDMTWDKTNETDGAKSDAETDNGTQQNLVPFINGDENIWRNAPLDDNFITPSVIVAETTEDDLKQSLRDLQDDVRETSSETEVFSEGFDSVWFPPGGGLDEYYGEGTAAVANRDKQNEVDQVLLGLTDRIEENNLDNLSTQDDVEEDDSFCDDLMGIEKECSGLSDLFSGESELEPSEIFRVRDSGS